MKPLFKRTATILLIIAAVFWGGVSVYALDAIDALHNGPLPVLPTQATVNNDYEVIATPIFTTPTPEPSDEIQPTATPALNTPALYPVDVRDVDDNGVRRIIKTYELTENERPDNIPSDSFERDGWRYELTDITKTECTGMDMRDHIKIAEMDSATNDVAAILKLLAPTMAYTSEDGYSGELMLDIASVKVEEAGSAIISFTTTITREYPHLSGNDTSLVPKTIIDNGKQYSLSGVTWRPVSMETIDYNQLPASYTAVATYSGTGTKTTVTGYITTAEYKGTIGKLLNGKTIYTAYFAGTEIAPPTPEPIPEPIPVPEPEQKSVTSLPVVAGTTAGAGMLGGVVFFFFIRKNVKVHNLKDGKYMPICKARATTRNPVVNLTPLADKAATGSFIIVLDRLAAKRLFNKTITVNYGDKSFQHIIERDGGEYQFEVDF